MTAKTTAGSGKANPNEPDLHAFSRERGPVSWQALGLVTITAASLVAYYKIERERRLEEAMGKIVSSESDGWSPDPEFLGKRKWKKTKFGWFPEDDAYGGGESSVDSLLLVSHLARRAFPSSTLSYALCSHFRCCCSAGKPSLGGPWSLVDLDGNLVTNKQFEGKWLLLYFGFARCPDICPSEMLKVGKVMDILAKDYPGLRQKVQPVFVSVDPARDSIKVLREYAKDFHPSYMFLTGTPEQVQQMAKKYRVYVSKADETEDGDYLVDHSIVIYFHDDTGDLADCFTQSMRPTDVVSKIVERMTQPQQI